MPPNDTRNTTTMPKGYIMLVTLGDGRVVECATGVTRLPKGPMPKVLASEISRPMRGAPTDKRDIDYVPPTRHSGVPRGSSPEENFAPVPSMLRASFDTEPPAPPVRATKATKRSRRAA